MLQLDDMALFAAVARAGSFTAAARALDLPLSTVSRRIAVLEQALDTRLLERTTRSLKLTEAGQVYLQYCQQMVTQAEDGRRALQRLKQEPEGHLRLSLPFSVDDSWATLLMSGFLAKYPKITIETMLRTEAVDLDDDPADIMMALGPRPLTHHPVVSLGSTRLALFASPRYLSRAGLPQTVEELAGHEMIRLTSLSWPAFAPPALRELTPNYRLTTNEALMARLTCVDGFGIAWLPVVTCLRYVQRGELVQIMPEQGFQLPLWLVHRSASRSTPKVALLVEHVVGLLGASGVWEALEQGRW